MRRRERGGLEKNDEGEDGIEEEEEVKDEGIDGMGVVELTNNGTL